jgi:glutamate--cysteine ligase
MRIAPRNQSTDENRDRIVAYFAAGGKGHGADAQGGLGVELEHILVHQGSGAAVSYAGSNGVCELLENLSPLYPDEWREEGVPNGSLLGLTDEGHTITLEPGSQVEISAAPMRRVAQVEAEYQLFRSRIDPLLSKMDIEFPMVGFHPTTAARDITLIPKFRYRCMGDYLGAISYLSQGMMRTSSSLQVSIDYADEADAIRKYRD